MIFFMNSVLFSMRLILSVLNMLVIYKLFVEYKSIEFSKLFELFKLELYE